MKGVGTLLQISAFILGIFGVIAGLAAGSSYRTSDNVLPLIVGGVISALVLWGIGGAFGALEDITNDTRRMANAIEQLVEELTPLKDDEPEPEPAKPSATRPLRPSNTDRLLGRIRSDNPPPT